mmetsp:Transcript_3532/g.3712  ORF Transcript_3532/g.3712 Transcript_3532/m.3712 type:complete len:294 (+) Transcript_3532:117-998(+)
MKTASSLLLLLIAAVSTIDIAYAITRRLGSTHHSLTGSSPSSRSISALGLQLSDTATIAREQQERRRRYSPATSSNKSTTSTASSKLTPTAEQVRGGGNSVIEKQFGEGVCVDNEGNLYSSPSSSTTLIASAALSKIRGGGVCVDNEGNFYSSRSVAVALPQEQEQIQRSQPSSLAAADHRRTILASSKSSLSASHSSSSTSKTAIPASSSGAKQGQVGFGRRQTSSTPFFRSPTPPIRGGELKNNMKNRIGDLCVDQEGNLYSSLSTLRGGGNGGGSGGLCVDNEGNLYASP